MDGWNTILSLWGPAHVQVRTVRFFRADYIHHLYFNRIFDGFSVFPFAIWESWIVDSALAILLCISASNLARNLLASLRAAGRAGCEVRWIILLGEEETNIAPP